MLRKLVWNAFRVSVLNLKKPEKNNARDWVVRFDALCERGAWDSAITLCESVLEKNGNDVDALQRSGRVHLNRGDFSASLDCFEKALTISKDDIECILGYANALYLSGDITKASVTYTSVLRHQPNNVGGLVGRARCCYATGFSNDALVNFERAFELDNTVVGVSRWIASILISQNRNADALFFLRRAANEESDSPEVLGALAHALSRAGSTDEAIDFYCAALALDQGNQQFSSNLGYLYFLRGEVRKAIEVMERAASIGAQLPELFNNLAIAYHLQGDLQRAEVYISRALTLRPDYADALANKGKILLEIGQLNEAEAEFRKALQVNPRSAEIHSNLLLCLNYDDHLSRESVFMQHKEWCSIYSAGVEQYPDVSEKRATGRIRIGYVSPDFVTHSVGFFIEPILEAHSREKFEIFCFTNSVVADETTFRLKKMSEHWLDISMLEDDQAANLVRECKIDILIDLAGHTARNRLKLFRLRPAPVQVTYLGYPNTTGLDSIDYRLTDARAEIDGADQYYSEELVRLDRCFLCYKPPAASPEVMPSPEQKNEFITFGSFNSFSKITDDVLDAWCRILQEVPRSRIFLKGWVYGHPHVRQRVLNKLNQFDVSQDRVSMLDRVAGLSEHLQQYGNIDISLDTFPYGGTTTTMESLWMGVPVVTLCGERHSARVGFDILANLGLHELVGDNVDSYIETAIKLAGNRQRLRELRGSLRSQLSESPLLDAEELTHTLEKFYESVWRES